MPEAGASGLERGRRGLFLAIVVLLLACGALLSDALFSSRVLSQADALEQFAPWSDDGQQYGDADGPSNPILLDQAIVMQPWLHFAGERLAYGDPATWNADNYMGQPMVGTYQSAYFWPLNWLYFLAPGWWFLEWSALLRLVAAGLFTLFFLRQLGLSRAPATLGAVTFALCGFQVAWLGHMHTHVSLFLPALLWAVERIAQRPDRRNAALLGILVAGALLAGHLQTALHLAMAVVAWTAFRATTEVGGERLSPAGLGTVVLGGALGLLVAMPQLLPFFDYLGDSRGAVVLEQVQTVDPISPLDAAILMVDPGHHGSPAAAQGYGPYTGPSGSNVNYNELIGGYVGRLALLLALVGAVLTWHRRDVRFLAVGAVVAACIAWQVPGIYDAFAALPKLKSTKLMRFAVVLAFALASLAAFGLAAVQARATERARGWIGAAAVALVALELVAFGRGYNPTIEPERLAPPTAVTDFLQARVADQPDFRVLPVDNTTLMPSANLLYGIPMLTGYDSMELATTADLVALLSNDERGAFFIKEIRRFDRTEALPLARLLGVRYLLSPIELPAPYELVLDGPTKVYEDPGVLPRSFAATGLRLIEERDERLAYLGSPGFDAAVAVLEELPPAELLGALPDDAAARLQAGEVVPLGAVDVTTGPAFENSQTFVLTATTPDAPGLVVLSEAWDADWLAELGHFEPTGERAATFQADRELPILRVDHGLRGLVVPPGTDGVLVLRYEPRALRSGLLLCLAGLVGLLVCLDPLRRVRV